MTKLLEVTSVLPIAGELIMFGDGEEYVRYSADAWEWCIGNSKEMVTDCGELEAAYQGFKTRGGGG